MIETLLLLIPLAASTILNIYLLWLAGVTLIENEELEDRLARAIEVDCDSDTIDEVGVDG